MYSDFFSFAELLGRFMAWKLRLFRSSNVSSYRDRDGISLNKVYNFKRSESYTLQDCTTCVNLVVSKGYMELKFEFEQGF